MNPVLKLAFLCAFAIPLPNNACDGQDTTVGSKPNVLVIITDDQGYGEFSCHGNPILQTPHLDRLQAESMRLTDFHVAPMCTPTRGQLMTGIDAVRNGATNVSSGRTLLRPQFPTMGQLFADSGYSSGLFGKWHLGDTSPYRPQDRGFNESVWFPSSHIGSVPDAWANDYFDDTYIHNGNRTTYSGYTTDVLFRESMNWMQQESDAGRPFFCYLATAAAHQPHYVPNQYLPPIQQALDKVRSTLPKLKPEAEEQLVRFLAMCANIDDNMGRLESFLIDRGLRDNTLVVFLTDNGSTFGPKYFNANMTGGKTTLWEGGHRVPCFVRWPAGGLKQPGDVAGLTQVQDLLPTFVELLGLKTPPQTQFDGISLARVLRHEADVPQERMLVINYSRMPFKATSTMPNNNAVVRRQRSGVLWKHWRLIEDTALYNLESDPLQQRNVIDEHPDVVSAMRSHLDTWWDGVKDLANQFEPSVIGHESQNPVLLTACEWADVFIDQQSQVRRGDRKNGQWHLQVASAGRYAFTLNRWPDDSGLGLRDGVDQMKVADGILSEGPAWPVHTARLQIGDQQQTAAVTDDASTVTFEMTLAAGPTTLQTWLDDENGKPICGAYYVNVQRLAPIDP
ncbi:Arylsulfatase precursor [Rubripirellula lacrimiformis]|uniref:Arylsulfatase n=1 Tax=Rubripirellula lacrimiformis TaxID=1930273 RepID=A0A517N5L5_9BACT|nr:arylsulfatase [Rubripirellula lacrimiformis]QDT02413.1 Arylsulfatase precursor [Rubripirellula lacrimiformis]